MNKKNKEILIFKRKNNKNMNDKKIKLIDSIQVKKLLKYKILLEGWNLSDGE